MLSFRQFHEETLDEKCWDTHTQQGMKKKGDKWVPNCVPKESFDESSLEKGEYDYEGDMAMSDLRSIMHNAQRLHDMLDPNTNLPEWCQSKITLAEDYISTVANYMTAEIKESEIIVTPRKTRSSFLPPAPGTYAADLAAGKYAKDGFTKSGKETAAKKRERMKQEDVEIDEDWQKVNKSDRTDGLSQKAVNAYRRENPGSKLQTAVTEKNPKGKRAARRKSFCSRMSGMKKRLTSAKNARDPDSPINKALRRWNC